MSVSFLSFHSVPRLLESDDHLLSRRFLPSSCGNESTSLLAQKGILTQISINVGIFAAQAFSSEPPAPGPDPVDRATRQKKKTDPLRDGKTKTKSHSRNR